jgi:hypothetical protein
MLYKMTLTVAVIIAKMYPSKYQARRRCPSPKVGSSGLIIFLL